MVATATPRASLRQFGAALLAPYAAMADLGENPPSSARVFFGAALWLGLCPPLFAFVGTTVFGWRLGVEPLFLPRSTIAAISAAYFVLLLVGLLSTALVARWMAVTYAADTSFSRCLVLVTLVGTPLALGSVVHLYPDAYVNVVVLVAALTWSMFFLYRGLPIILKTDPARGMMMASFLVAYVLISWVTLLCVTAVLWGLGIGPRIAT